MLNTSISMSLRPSDHARKNKVTVIWVGPLVTALHVSQIKKGCADYILRKEWDFSVRNLLEALANKADLHKVKGLTWLDGTGAIVVNEDEPPIENLDSLPIPAYDLLRSRKFYEKLFCQVPPQP